MFSNPSGMNDQQFISINDAYQLTGIATLRKMADTEKVRSHKTPSGQRKFQKLYLARDLGKKSRIEIGPRRRNQDEIKMMSNRPLYHIH
jgi:hypothetical protein